jgi:uridine kinase
LIVDGIFLQRPEIRHFWNLVIFLDAPFEVTVPRGARRGPDFGSPDPHAASNKRYVEGQKLYIAEAIPLEHASIVIDNSRLFSPFIVQRKLVDVERVSIELSPLP